MPSNQSTAQRKNHRARANRWAAKARKDPAKRQTLLDRTTAWKKKNKQKVADYNERRNLLVIRDRERQHRKGRELDNIGHNATVITASQLRTPRYIFEHKGKRTRETLHTEGPTDPIAAEPQRRTTSAIDRILDENDELYLSLIDEQQS
jgi:hypothetical protein